jgi:hypothetical protein
MALSSELRSTLEKAVVSARDAAENASRAALGVLAVDVERAPDHLGEAERRLRVALRAEARQLGGFERLVEECAYEQWHRMLFARFLSENDLLIHPEHGVPVTLAECEEIAESRGGSDLWLVASEFASTMLPGIFRSDDPVLQLTLAPEGQQRLEELLAALPREVFTSKDGLGWVYQYWQAKKKKEVNASERKIGGADIAPVTQLFTENYMVRFLLENTLGAWWAAHHSESPLIKEWEYLRFDEGGKPAAGSFPGWPETVAEVTVMDPCCGSGHFLVVAFEMLRKMRMEAEGLSEAEADEAVLRENLFGLELDPRCTQIAAFALALQAWKTGGYRELPIPNIACSGISAKGHLEDWKKLAKGDERLERSLERLHGLFSDAGDLGSLIDPLRETDGELLAAQFEEVAPLLDEALKRESVSDPAAATFGRAAAAVARAAALLGRPYYLIATNPPFLARGKQADSIRKFADRHHPGARGDLAVVFVSRCLRFVSEGGAVAAVAPQNWWELGSYVRFREAVLDDSTFHFAASLGFQAFSTPQWDFNTSLSIVSSIEPSDDWTVATIDASDRAERSAKAEALRTGTLGRVRQRAMRLNPDSRITLIELPSGALLSKIAQSYIGLHVGDDVRHRRHFWEMPSILDTWQPIMTSPSESDAYSGRQSLIYWPDQGRMHVENPSARVQGIPAWHKRGVAVRIMGDLPVTLYDGQLFGQNVAAVIPEDVSLLPAIWCYLSSPEYGRAIRAIDKKLNVTSGTLVKASFDQTHWTEIAAERYPKGLPKPESQDPTQWLFNGLPLGATEPLHVAAVRLAGYRWPRQTGSEFPDCPALGPDGLEPFADEDGICCIPSLRGERPAAERLRALLAAAFGEDWSPTKEADLLAEVGYGGKSLEQWLRDGFFEQHCQLFHQRPFVWQIWDRRKDGFTALVNYHRLDRASLEKLIYTYLGEWIRQQRESAAVGTPGADLRLAAAEELQRELELILEGQDPYDIFVRWKPLEEQPLGWEPDLDDGVRLNIRPFVTAGVLRKNPKIKWGKDRGTDPESAPCYPVFKGDRINDHHLTLAEKREAREAAERRAAAP